VVARLLGLVVLLAFGAPLATGQTQAPCEERPMPVLFAENDGSLENLAFDGAGSLYLSDAGGARILRLAPDGTTAAVLDLDAHGITWGPDGRLYAAVTAGEETYDILRSTDGTVTAFEPYSAGLPVYNGMAFDAAGNLFVSDDSVTPPVQPPDLVRVPAADPMAWEPWADLYGPNGLAYDAASGALYTVITADQSSPVMRLSPTDPGAVEVVAYLSYGAATLEPGTHAPQGDPAHTVPKGLDDLALGPDGRLYITAHLSGELLRLDPTDGSACLLASGLEEPTSARFAHGFGPHDGKLFVTTWGGTGVTGLALGNVGMHPAGKVWVFDLGFGDASGSANGTETGPQVFFDDNDFGDEPGADKDASAVPGIALLLAIGWIALARRRLR
jgi:DNA-binding beta-propeller fold protein YncE